LNGDPNPIGFVLSVVAGRIGRWKVIQALFALLRLLTVPQPDAWAATVLVDEIDPSAFQHFFND
jgi:hypothetical protein